MRGDLLVHLAEHLLFLSTATSFWYSLNSSYDHEFHLYRGAGSFIYGKVHGDAARKADAAIVLKEQANHEQEERVRSMSKEK